MASFCWADQQLAVLPLPHGSTSRNGNGHALSRQLENVASALLAIPSLQPQAARWRLAALLRASCVLGLAPPTVVLYTVALVSFLFNEKITPIYQI